ncbi:MAG: DUF4114 domain-containing protein [Pirellulaceae bacterium]
MKRRTLRLTAFLLTVCMSSNLVADGGSGTSGPTVSPVQSPARPLDLPVHGPVYSFASDARSADFYTNVMPEFLTIINDTLSESVVFEGVQGFKLDASKLLLRTASDAPIRIYFLFEGAGYHNTLGYTWTPAGEPEKGAKSVLFPDASIKHSGNRTTWEPLKVGDFVEIGTGDNGWQLDFFLISNAVNGGTTPLWADETLNSDGLQHMVAFMIPDSRFILLGFEDIVGGGDLDYNDALFVVDIGQVNAENLLDEASLPH